MVADDTSARATDSTLGTRDRIVEAGRHWDEAFECLATDSATLLKQWHRRFTSGPIAWPKG